MLYKKLQFVFLLNISNIFGMYVEGNNDNTKFQNPNSYIRIKSIENKTNENKTINSINTISEIKLSEIELYKLSEIELYKVYEYIVIKLYKVYEYIVINILSKIENKNIQFDLLFKKNLSDNININGNEIVVKINIFDPNLGEIVEKNNELFTEIKFNLNEILQEEQFKKQKINQSFYFLNSKGKNLNCLIYSICNNMVVIYEKLKEFKLDQVFHMFVKELQVFTNDNKIGEDFFKENGTFFNTLLSIVRQGKYREGLLYLDESISSIKNTIENNSELVILNLLFSQEGIMNSFYLSNEANKFTGNLFGIYITHFNQHYSNLCIAPNEKLIDKIQKLELNENFHKGTGKKNSLQEIKSFY